MPAFRITVSETHNKEYVVTCANREAAEDVAADVMLGAPVDPAHVTRPVLITADQKNSTCSIQQEPDGIYEEAAKYALHAS